MALCLGIAVLGAAVFTASRPGAENPTETERAAARSGAYDFGYASAALAACDGLAPDLRDVLAARVEKDPTGRVADEISEGFRAFSRTLEALGPPGACSAVGGIVNVRR